MLREKDVVIQSIVEKFKKRYHSRGDNMRQEKDLRAQLAKHQKTRQKYLDMYAEELVTKEELRQKLDAIKKCTEQLEGELKLVTNNLTRADVLDSLLHQTFRTLEDVTDVRQMTNAQLRRIVDKITVDKDGNVDIYLRVLDRLGLDETVLVPDLHTQGPVGAAFAV